MKDSRQAYMDWNDSGIGCTVEWQAFLAGWKANESDGNINYEINLLKQEIKDLKAFELEKREGA